MSKIVLLILVLGFVSYLLTYLIKKVASKYKIIDIPNERSSHVNPTPRGGGLAIVITWYIGISILFFFNIIERNLYFAFLCGIVLAIISLIDDIVNVKPFFRLVAQIITSIGTLVFLKGINSIFLFGIEIDFWFILYPIAIVGIVWFINLFNFLDGIDAYVSVETIFLAIVFFLFTEDFIALVLIASVVGFLYWNWPKAKIFMGDVGSTQLGFILIVLGIYFHNQNELSILYWILLTSPFWFDATFTLYRRWRNKEKLSVAHKKHAYQRIVQAGFTHLKTDIYLLAINTIILGIVFVTRRFDFLYIPALILVLAILYVLTREIDKRKSF